MTRLCKRITAVLCLALGTLGASAQTMMPGPASTGGNSSGLQLGLQQSSVQNETLGSVTGTASPQPMALSLADAIERGLRQNLGLLISDDAQLSAHGQLWEARSPLLPNISAKVEENVLKVNLAAEGFPKLRAYSLISPC